MQTFEILNYAVTHSHKQTRQQLLRRIAALFGCSAKYIEKWCLPSGGDTDTGERNLLDRVELLLWELWDICPEAVTFCLTRWQRIYNQMIENHSSPIKRVELLREMNRVEAVLLDLSIADDDAWLKVEIERLRAVLDRAIGAQATPAAEVVSNQLSVKPRYYANGFKGLSR